MDEYDGFWVNWYGSGMEGHENGNGVGEWWADGWVYGNWDGGGNGNGISRSVKDHREG